MGRWGRRQEILIVFRFGERRGKEGQTAGKRAGGQADRREGGRARPDGRAAPTASVGPIGNL